MRVRTRTGMHARMPHAHAHTLTRTCYAQHVTKDGRYVKRGSDGADVASGEKKEGPDETTCNAALQHATRRCNMQRGMHKAA